MVARTARGEKYLHYVALGIYKPTGKKTLNLSPAEMLEHKRKQWRESNRRQYYKRKLLAKNDIEVHDAHVVPENLCHQKLPTPTFPAEVFTSDHEVYTPAEYLTEVLVGSGV